METSSTSPAEISSSQQPPPPASTPDPNAEEILADEEVSSSPSDHNHQNDQENAAVPPQESTHKAVSFRHLDVPSGNDNMEEPVIDKPVVEKPVVEKSTTILKPTVGTHMDLATGAQTRRCQSIHLVSQEDQAPSAHHYYYNQYNAHQHQHTHKQGGALNNLRHRRRRASTTTVRRSQRHLSSFDNADPHEKAQYRIQSQQLPPETSSERGWRSWFVRAQECVTQSDAGSRSRWLLATTTTLTRLPWLTSYLHWTFRTSFFNVTMASMAAFMVLITAFAVLVYWIGQAQPECIVGVDVGNGTIAFGDAYHLSWTTLSTVGYGVVAPGLPSTTTSDDHPNGHHCGGINILMAFEAFVGVLFSGVTGAIVFAKVARIQSIASVVFSDPLVIRYGTGCLPEPTYEDDNPQDHNELPCPILEFRMINTMWSQKGGEIMDATVNLIASRQETMEEVGKRLSPRRKRRKKKKGRARRKMPIKKKHPKHSHGGPHNNNKDHPSDEKQDPSEPEDDDTHQEEHSDEEEEEHPTQDSPTATLVTDPSLDSEPDAASAIRSSLSRRSLLGSSPRSKLGSSTRSKSIASGGFFQRVNQSVIQSAISEATASSRSIIVEREDPEDLEPYNHAARESIQQAVEQEVENRMTTLEKTAAAVVANAATVTVDEGNVWAPRQIFYTMEVETDSHPFFRRKWIIRHVCNENSPLLSQSVRERIEENDGYWPPELNNYDAVRKAINFHEIIVSFSGTANCSGSAVYSQKVYSYVDMAVGYTFANVLAKDRGGKLIVDSTLLNDVKPQNGGGAEPIQHKDNPQFVGYGTARAIAVDFGVTMVPIDSSLQTDVSERDEKKVDDMV